MSKCQKWPPQRPCLILWHFWFFVFNWKGGGGKGPALTYFLSILQMRNCHMYIILCILIEQLRTHAPAGRIRSMKNVFVRNLKNVFVRIIAARITAICLRGGKLHTTITNKWIPHKHTHVDIWTDSHICTFTHINRSATSKNMTHREKNTHIANSAISKMAEPSAQEATKKSPTKKNTEWPKIAENTNLQWPTTWTERNERYA